MPKATFSFEFSKEEGAALIASLKEKLPELAPVESVEIDQATVSGRVVANLPLAGKCNIDLDVKVTEDDPPTAAA